MRSGRIDNYYWYEFEEMPPQGLLAVLSARLLGLRAINTSWDSGSMTPNGEQIRQGWSIHGRTGVTPAVTSALVLDWPSPDHWCDEWWFFKDVPPDLDPPHGYCNYLGTSLAEWRSMDLDGSGPYLARYLRRHRPEAIIGNGTWTYCILRVELSELASWMAYVFPWFAEPCLREFRFLEGRYGFDAPVVEQRRSESLVQYRKTDRLVSIAYRHRLPPLVELAASTHETMDRRVPELDASVLDTQQVVETVSGVWKDTGRELQRRVLRALAQDLEKKERQFLAGQ